METLIEITCTSLFPEFVQLLNSYPQRKPRTRYPSGSHCSTCPFDTTPASVPLFPFGLPEKHNVRVFFLDKHPCCLV